MVARMKKNSPNIVSLYRHKTLLALLQAFGGKLSNIDLQKLLFLFTQQCQQDKSYHFVPFRYGCFSFQSYADRRKFVERGIISDNPDTWHLTADTVHDFVDQLSPGDKGELILFRERYANLRGDTLLKEVYTRFPYYATRSEIAGRILSDEELQAVSRHRPSQRAARFFTIGYEGKGFERYLNQLIENNVKLLCDVRKNPLSRKYGFSKRVLSETLQSLGIAYVHLPALGIVSDKRRKLSTPNDYSRLFDEYEATTLRDNEAALQQLFELMRTHKRVAITCFEAEECMCHRGRVAKALQALPEWQFKVQHL